MFSIEAASGFDMTSAYYSGSASSAPPCLGSGFVSCYGVSRLLSFVLVIENLSTHDGDGCSDTKLDSTDLACEYPGEG